MKQVTVVTPKSRDADTVTVWNPEEPAYQAHKLRIAGHDWRAVAELTGYANPQSAKLSVRAYLQRAAADLSAEHRQEALQEQLDRIEELIRVYWPTAVTGDIKHAEFVLKATTQIANLLGLDTLHEKTGQSSKTIVITSEGYAKALQAVAEQS